MSIMRNFNLYLNAGNGSAPYINANQYDQGEQWVFTLYKEDGTKYTPSTGAIVGIKADNRGIINTGTVDADGRVVINETQQMTAASGIAIFELLIDGDSHGTANFLVNVEQRPGDNADLSDSDLSLIQQAVDSAAVIVEVIGDSDPSEVIGEHVDDWLDNHPEATTTVQDGAITAPKINSTLWDKLLVSEETSGNPASFDDGADDVPVKSLKVALEPIQTGSGDPSPSNVRPIYPANGKNLLDVSTVQIGKAWNTSANNDRAVVYIPCKPNTKYTFSINDRSAFSALVWVEKESASATTSTYLTTFNGKTTNWTTKSTSNVIVIQFSKTGISASDFVGLQMQMELGSAVSPYQPYQGIMVERTGKNLLDASTFVNKAWNGDGAFATRARPTHAIIVPIGSTLTVSVSDDFLTKYVYAVLLMDKDFPASSTTGDSGWRSVATTTVTMATQYLGINIKRIDNGDVDLTDLQSMKIQVEYGNTATAYVPFVEGASYPISLGQFVYGGTVDLATGVLTVTHVMWTDSGTGWTMNNDGSFYKAYSPSPTSVQEADGCACNYAPYAISYSGMAVFARPNGLISLGNGWGSVYPDVALLQAAFASTPIQIVYKLATPQTIQLTPTQVKTLLGYNNISSSGTVEVIYHADTKLYVDKEVSKAKSIIAGIEAEFKATKNYTTGDLLIIGDDLYKCTANIANGSTITVNTNVTKTTVAEQLIALA